MATLIFNVGYSTEAFWSPRLLAPTIKDGSTYDFHSSGGFIRVSGPGDFTYAGVTADDPSGGSYNSVTAFAEDAHATQLASFTSAAAVAFGTFFTGGAATALAGPDTITGSASADFIAGHGGNDTLLGGAGNDLLFGGVGRDVLNGDAGSDTLTGGPGRDTLTGGPGRDFFDFNSISETRKGATHRDKITDFHHGTNVTGDDIDLRTIDAKTGVSGNQAFKFIGSHPFHHVKGELHTVKSGANVIVQGDVNGDGKVDFEILVNISSLSKGDFVL